MWALYSLLCLIPPVLSQLPLPQPPWLPPNAASGAQPSSGGSPNPQWSNIVGNLLYFYEAQRAGKLPSTNRVPWRNDSVLSDGQDRGVDLSKGYFDAGNFIKCTYPLSFSVMSICWGAMDYGKGYDSANQTAYLDDMLRWSLDWLMKAHSDNNTLYVLVADGAKADDTYWGGDQNIPVPRPSYQINNTSPGTDAAALASAAFSSCASLYSGRSFNGSFAGPAALQDAAYANTLMTHAEQLYTFAQNATGGKVTYQTSVPAAADSYASSGFGDDLTMAALFLALAEGSPARYQEAASLYQQYKLSGQDPVFNWDSKTPGLAVLFAQIAQASSDWGADPSPWQSEAERYFDNILQSGFLTPGGLLYYNGDSDEASLNPSLNAAMLLARYAQVATSPSKKSSYLNYSQKQVDYVLGKNPMSAPYVVGVNPNSPSNPHSAMASGGNDIGQIDTSPPQEAYVLYGAVVGGPDKRDNFYDIRSDWPQAEVAIDYNAPMLTLAAMHSFDDTSDPFYTSLQAGAYDKVRPQGQPCDAAIQAGCSNSQLSKGAKIAIAVVVTVVGLLVIGGATWFLCLLRSKKKKLSGPYSPVNYRR